MDVSCFHLLYVAGAYLTVTLTGKMSQGEQRERPWQQGNTAHTLDQAQIAPLIFKLAFSIGFLKITFN